MEENETYESIAKNLLKVSNIKNYKKYVRDIYLDKFLSKDCKEDYCKITILKKVCFHPPCFNTVINDNYCSNNLNYKFIS